VDFDRYRTSYSEEVNRAIAFSGRDLDHFTRVKARVLLHVVDRHLGDPGALTALDVGCGIGLTDRFLAGSFGRLEGCDIAPRALEVAALQNPTVSYRCYDGARLPFAEGAFDVSFAICVLHHVAPAQWTNFLEELRRVTHRGGLAVVFEHNPWNPLTRWAVRSCAFDEGAVLLSKRKVEELFRGQGLRVAEAGYLIFSPFGGERSATAERRLRRLPMGAQYYVAGRVPPAV
jgi:SAM-dependent methyltransferase